MDSQSILLVEDHVDSATSLARVLAKQGHRVHIAGNLAEARSLVASHHFDVAVCDLGLPDGDGCDLMRELTAQYGLKGIALTGHAMPDDIERASRAGFAARLLKPVTFEKLLDVLQQVTSPAPGITTP